MGRQPGSIIIGIGLVAIGAWIVTIQLGVRLARFRYMWPALVALLSVAFLVQYLFQQRKQGGLIFLGTAGLTIGIFLNLFTLRVGGLTWADMARYWPIIPLCLGLAFLILYLAEGMRQHSLLIPTYLIGGIGLFALPITLRIAQGPLINQVIRFWPILAVLLVLAIVIRPRQPDKDTE